MMPAHPFGENDAESRETRVAEVLQQIRAGVRQRQAELAAQRSWAEQARLEPLEQRLSELRTRAHIRERPFSSQLPVVGRLVAFFRETWNNVAAKWYVRPMLHQQNIFNQMVVQIIQDGLTMQAHRLDEMNLYVNQLDERLIYGDRDVTQLARKAAEGEYQMRLWQRQVIEDVERLTERLDHFEEKLNMAIEQSRER
jgi:hypothetical protein